LATPHFKEIDRTAQGQHAATTLTQHRPSVDTAHS
jgi:hypothetical protein